MEDMHELEWCILCVVYAGLKNYQDSMDALQISMEERVRDCFFVPAPSKRNARYITRQQQRAPSTNPVLCSPTTTCQGSSTSPALRTHTARSCFDIPVRQYPKFMQAQSATTSARSHGHASSNLPPMLALQREPTTRMKMISSKLSESSKSSRQPSSIFDIQRQISCRRKPWLVSRCYDLTRPPLRGLWCCS